MADEGVPRRAGGGRPLELLAQDPRRKYVLVTDAAVERSLYRFRLDDACAFGPAGRPPGHSGRALKGSATADVGRRIGVIPPMDRERLRHRTETLLRRHGHVPLTRLEGCVQALKASVRARVLGDERTPLTNDLVLDVIRSFDGAMASDPRLALYVPPRNFATIRGRLDERNVVIVAGPSGTGKTMTADAIGGRAPPWQNRRSPSVRSRWLGAARGLRAPAP